MALTPESLLEFARSLKGGADASSNVKQATVTRVDADGTVYVNIPGGEIETPVSNKSADVAVGDKVMVAARNGQLTIQGNYSKPSTDDTVANQARQMSSIALSNADAAAVAAGIAQASADTAAAAAASAETSASDALTAAGNAQRSANNALASATQANEYASRALGNLSTVQSVAETLTWIAEHGTMALTSDTALDPTHVYFVQDADGDYVVNNVHYSIVSEPVASALSTYYELTIDESLNNYVGTHLALTADGLWLLPESTGSHKVLIATGAGSTYTTAGTYIIDSAGSTVAYFGVNGARIGPADNAHISITRSDTTFYGYGGASMGSIGSTNNETTGLAVMTQGGYCSSIGVRDNGAYIYGYGIQTECAINGFVSAKLNGSSIDTSTLSKPTDWVVHCSLATSSADYLEVVYTTYDVVGKFELGNNARATGKTSFAMGDSSYATAANALAIGSTCSATGRCSQAFGVSSKASGAASFAANSQTRASSSCQTAIGRYNIEDTSNEYAFIIGNGLNGYRSNALAVDWSGNIDIGGVHAYMTFVTTAIASFSPPSGVTSCLVLDTSDYGLYWYTA